MKIKNKYLKLLFSKLLRFPARLNQLITRQYRKINRHRFIKVLFFATLLICLSFGQIVSAQAPNPNSLVERGIQDYNNGNFRSAVKHWQSALGKYKNNPSVTAVVNENLGRVYQKIGEDGAAIESLSAAIRDYEAVKDIKQVGRMQTELAQVYNSLGQPRKAIAILSCLPKKSESSENQGVEEKKCISRTAEIAIKYKDKRGQLAALGVLGESYRLVGNYDRAIEYLQAAYKVAPDNFLVLNNLGQAYKNRAQLIELRANSAKQARLKDKETEFNQKSADDYDKASQYLQDSIDASRGKEPIAQMQGLLNFIQLATQTNKTKAIDDETFNSSVTSALKVLDTLPDSTTKVYGAINLAYLQRNSQGTSPFISCPTQLVLPENQALSLLNKSVLTSNNLKDNRLQSYANGALGHFWECRQDNKRALQYTQSAIIAADNKLRAKDSLYLWEWQAGRILKQQKRTEEAIKSYQRAYETLEDIRQDILTAKRDVQFDFRDVVRPLYRTLAQSRLELLQAGAIEDEKNAKRQLSQVVETIDALKLAELQNFFGNDCILNALNPKKVDELIGDKENSSVFENTAFLSSIILDGKTGILLQSPNKATKFQWIQDSNQTGTDKIVSTEKLEKTITEFRQGLIRGREALNYDTTTATQLYDWIIRPFVDDGDISPETIKTLVFLQDGFLRSVPMAALYDSQQKKYLIENYAIATTPSLRITTSNSRRSKQKALILGLTESATIDGKTFDKLSWVDKEVSAVKEQFPNHTPLIDKDFIPQKFQQEIQQTTYPIVHIASHAQFGIIPEDTFIVTGENQKLTISELENSLLNLKNRTDSVELLALTACETAVGDDRSTLGLAGVALKVGVKSAVASLWNVQDASTSKLVEEFYKNYRQEKMSIAEALQKAQIKMINAKKLPPSEGMNIEYENPAHWAPMIVIGNWL
ncbi:MAG: CHAT domain-containing protein [Cyanobacteria bacterium P01_H01_bin.150]